MTYDVRQRFTIPPAALFAMAAGAQQLGKSDRPGILGRIGTAALVVSAAWFGIGSVAEFRMQSTTVTPMDVEKVSTLVTSGPNRVSRNPMYVALLLLLLANAWRRGSLVGLLPSAAFVAMIDRFQIPKEEAALERSFGEEYLEYRTTTPRWLGM